HRPDLIIKNPDEDLVGLICVEVELSLKSKKRYDEIFRVYIDNIKKKKINQVIYIFYDEKTKAKFENNLLNPYIKNNMVDDAHSSKIDVWLRD
ncbi:hypothetical protein, partial [Vibrio atlanticus]|uniref:hypothetical protein n=1 Tax=Vibrio atlanticus TaxID=693153 RepID=UPI003552FE99